MWLTDYHRECRSAAQSDGRWEFGGDDERCRVCGLVTDAVCPAGASCCPWCWDWEVDTVAPEKPKLPKSGPPLPNATLPCIACEYNGNPRLEWRKVGKKKKHTVLAAFCRRCEVWIKWTRDKDHLARAPERPREPAQMALAIQDGEETTERGESADARYFDTSAGGERTKSGGRKSTYTPPPPEDCKPVSMWDIRKSEGRIIAAGCRLYLDADGVLRCLPGWSCAPADDAAVVKRNGAYLRDAISQHIEYQLGLATRTPHVIRFWPYIETIQRARARAWADAVARGWRVSDWSAGIPSGSKCSVCGRPSMLSTPDGVQRHPWCAEKPVNSLF